MKPIKAITGLVINLRITAFQSREEPCQTSTLPYLKRCKRKGTPGGGVTCQRSHSQPVAEGECKPKTSVPHPSVLSSTLENKEKDIWKQKGIKTLCGFVFRYVYHYITEKLLLNLQKCTLKVHFSCSPFVMHGSIIRTEFSSMSVIIIIWILMTLGNEER